MAEALTSLPSGFVVDALPAGFVMDNPGESSLRRHFQQRPAQGFSDYIKAGFGQSVTGLATSGGLPEVALTDETPWYGRAAASVAGIVGDIPAMIPGFMAGSYAGQAAGAAVGSAVPAVGTTVGSAAGGLIGGFAGANAAPAGIRQALVEMYKSGEATDGGTFLDKALRVAWETFKGGAVGAATGGAGVAAKAVLPLAGTVAGRPLLPAAGTFSRTAADATIITAAEVSTMATTAAALEGHLPAARDFMDAAILIGGIKSTAAISKKLMTVYERTGKTPAEVVADAQRDPTIAQDLVGAAANTEPPVPEGMTRLYHGSAEHGRYDGPAWFSSSRAYAENYRGKAAELQYIDYPTEKVNAILDPDGYGQTVQKGFTFSAELNSSETGLRRPVAPRGTSEKTSTESTAIPRAYEPLAADQAARAAVPDAMTNEPHALNIAAVLTNPEGAITADKVPNHINYRYIESPQDVQAIHARVSEVFEKQIEEARGKQTWDQTKAKAEELLAKSAKMDQAAIDALNPDQFNGLAARAMAQQAMSQRAAYDIFDSMRAIEAASEADKPQAFRDAVAAIEMSAMMQAAEQGVGAEIARAMNARKAAKQTGELVQSIKELEAKYGNDPNALAKAVLKLETVEQVNKFAKDASKATKWEMVVEYLKSAMLSGPLTSMRNIIGNTSMLPLQPAIDLGAALFDRARGAPISERVSFMEPIARISGNISAALEVVRVASMLDLITGKPSKLIDVSGKDLTKVDQYREAIPGLAGDIIRVPFKLLSIQDQMFKAINERGEAHALATREAVQAGFDPRQHDFADRVAQNLLNPSKKTLEEIEKAGLRATFNTPAAKGGSLEKVQQLVKLTHMEWAFPFIRTPTRILEETIRLTPFAPLVGSWREAIKQGGEAKSKAVAEVAVGAAFMTAMFALALKGVITGAGDPDAAKRGVKQAAGDEPPYSIGFGNKWFGYQGLGPIATLIGISADSAKAWMNLSDDEGDKVAKILAIGFANAVTSQTALMGMTNIVNIGTDPDRYGPKFFQGLAGMPIPALVSQPTQITDPFAREVNSMLEAAKARTPILRQELLPKIDVFGEPVKGKERVGDVTPITVVTESEDKVRTEAARLGISVSAPPKEITVVPGAGKMGKVEILPEDRNAFAIARGKLAHEVLTKIVNDPQWDALPPLVKRKIYTNVFKKAYAVGAVAAFPPELRGEFINEIVENISDQMKPEEVQ